MVQSSNIVPLRRRKARAPNIENGKVRPPARKTNREVRSREHLTPDEVERLISSAKSLGRHGHRDATLILVAYRHGLRVSELVALRWDMVNLKQGLLHVNRLKNGVASTHPIRGPEIRALRQLQRDYPRYPLPFCHGAKRPADDLCRTQDPGQGRKGSKDRTTGTSSHASAQRRLQASQ